MILGYSTIDESGEDNKDDVIESKPKSKTKHNITYKKKGHSKKVTKLLNKIQNDTAVDSDDDSDYVNYTPIGNGVEDGVPREEEGYMMRTGIEQRNKYAVAEQLRRTQVRGHQSMPANDMSSQGTYSTQDTYNPQGTYNPQTSMMAQGGHQDDLMKKLNYVVHLLEEQQDEKTGGVIEELILYIFLGVFVIFVVDSFSRSRKYKR